MQQPPEAPAAAARAVVTYRTVELAVAALAFAFGATVIADSWRLGARWGDDGPQAGYFPFYIGLLICGASAWTFWKSWRNRRKGSDTFVTHAQLRQIAALLVPAVLYAAAIGYIGIYVASSIFVAYFMARHGDHRWWTTVCVAVGSPLALFLMFEIWFKTPLPKGPLEAWLGLS
ncbi:MAG: tripartite tricarboxylate transporter TctB family protein [Gemmatimonadota bacterium]